MRIRFTIYALQAAIDAHGTDNLFMVHLDNRPGVYAIVNKAGFDALACDGARRTSKIANYLEEQTEIILFVLSDKVSSRV